MIAVDSSLRVKPYKRYPRGNTDRDDSCTEVVPRIKKIDQQKFTYY